SVDNIYTTFLKITSEAREMDVENVHEIAQGRVWTGATAKELGLVDNLGSLNDVIDAAAANLNMTDFNVKEIVRPLSTREQILRSLMQASARLGNSMRNAFINGTLGLEFDDTTALNISELLNQGMRGLILPSGSHNEVLAQCVECLAP